MIACQNDFIFPLVAYIFQGRSDEKSSIAWMKYKSFITDVKEEKHSPSHKSKPSGQGTNKLKSYCHSLPKQVDAVLISSQKESASPASDDGKVSSNYDFGVSTAERFSCKTFIL